MDKTQNYDSLEALVGDLIDKLSTSQSSSDSKVFDTHILNPGYYVVLKKDTTIYYGVVLSNGYIMYFTSTGSIVGYCAPNSSNITVLKVYKPTEYNFTLNSLDYMDLIYEAPKKVTKSISEIEKALGLEPGTLEIK